MPAPLLRLQDVGKQFFIDTKKRTLLQWLLSKANHEPLHQDFWALRNVSLEVRSGEKIALVGRNGAGKTVLLRIIAGIFNHTEGSVYRAGPVTPLFRYNLGTDANLTVVDSVFVAGAFYGLLRNEIKKKLDDIVDFCELKNFLYLPVRNLSQGQGQRLSFSIFIQAQNSFLAFDEVTVFSDLNFQQKTDAYFDRMMNSDKTILMASHDLDRLKRHCQKALWLDQGRIVQFGPAAEVIETYRRACLTGF